ncbi:MAG: energy-coupled thiamine transporter ThiT [Lachnospiraceae bacterium]
MSILLKWVAEEERYTLSPAGYALFIIAIILLLLIASLLTGVSKKKQLSTRQLAFCSMSIALATVTSFIKVFSFPTGGSITLLSMFFICFIGYLYGAKIGILSAVAFGILQLIIEPKIYFPMQILIDYVLAFGALGISGFFSQKKWGMIVGYLAGITGRFVFTTISGVLFFGEYAWEGWNPVAYSTVYNAIYIFAEGAVTILILLVPTVRAQLQRVRNMAVESQHL